MRVPWIQNGTRDRHEPEAAVDHLVMRAQEGDDDAFEGLARRYEKPIYELAMKLVGDFEAAEDLALETFAQAYRDLPRFSGRSTFFTWLYRIATNLCFRHLQRRRMRPEDHHPPDELEGFPETGAEDETTQQVLTNMGREALLRCLGRLSERQRVVLFLFYFEGHTYLEISRALGIPASTAKSHVRRGTTRLRSVLTDAGLLETEGGGGFGQTSHR